MKEAQLWSTIRQNLMKYPKVALDRIENVVSKGMPDVSVCRNGVEAWLELKHEHQFPVRPNSVVRFPCYSDAQRLWQRTRMAAGGRVFVMCQVDNEYFLFNARDAVNHLSIDWNHADMKFNAVYYGYRGKVDWGKVLDLLCPTSLMTSPVQDESSCPTCGRAYDR